MKAILLRQFGKPEEMYIGDTDTPILQAEEVLIEVKAFALNRADTLQRTGMYPPPPGDSEIIGLEIAGDIIEISSKGTHWKVGDRVCALVGGGGYATYCKSTIDMLISIPDGMSYTTAAGIPEAYLTAWQALVWHAQLKAGEKILIHAGGSGVGLAAIQIAKQIGAQIAITASSGKHKTCKENGADVCIDYQIESFDKVIADQWGSVDVIIDFIGGAYLEQNMNAIGMDGRIVVLGLMGGWKNELNMALLLRKRVKLMGSTLRARSHDYKVALTKDLRESLVPHIVSGAVNPVIDTILPWTEIIQAHQRMEANLNTGKIIMMIG